MMSSQEAAAALEQEEANERADDAFTQRHGETCGRCFEMGLYPRESCPTCGLPT
jgi:uncharacterized OB-fold protein